MFAARGQIFYSTSCANSGCIENIWGSGCGSSVFYWSHQQRPSQRLQRNDASAGWCRKKKHVTWHFKFTWNHSKEVACNLISLSVDYCDWHSSRTFILLRTIDPSKWLFFLPSKGRHLPLYLQAAWILRGSLDAAGQFCHGVAVDHAGWAWDSWLRTVAVFGQFFVVVYCFIEIAWPNFVFWTVQ